MENISEITNKIINDDRENINVDHSNNLDNISFNFNKMCSRCNLFKRMSTGGCEYSLVYDEAEKDLESFIFKDDIINYIRENIDNEFLIDQEKKSEFIISYQILNDYLRNNRVTFDTDFIIQHKRYMQTSKIRDYFNTVLIYILIEKCGFDIYNSSN